MWVYCRLELYVMNHDTDAASILLSYIASELLNFLIYLHL